MCFSFLHPCSILSEKHPEQQNNMDAPQRDQKIGKSPSRQRATTEPPQITVSSSQNKTVASPRGMSPLFSCNVLCCSIFRLWCAADVSHSQML